MIKLCTIKDINKIKELECVDGFILPTIYSIYYEKAFSKEEIKEAIILSSALNKKIIVSVDMIICEDDLEEVYSFLDEISPFNCDIMFSDLAVLDYFKKRGELYKLIYNAHTYITNKEDIKYYKNLGIKVLMSNELSLDDTIENAKNDNLILEAYGYFPIYYSKRRVLSLYKEYANLDYDAFDNFEIKEELRDEKYIIKEYSKMPHSVILSTNKICIFEELEKIKPKCIFINDDNEDVIKIYDDAINTGFTEDKKLALSKICERIDKSLLYIRPSILNKDE